MKKKVINSTVSWVIDAERVLFPDCCSLLDRCRVVALLFLTLCEACIIPFHLVLFGVLGDKLALGQNVAYLLIFAAIEYLVWTLKTNLGKGLAGLFLLVVLKLVVDCGMSLLFGHPDDNLSVSNNIYILFILAYTSCLLRLRRVGLVINLVIACLFVMFLVQKPSVFAIFTAKGIFVGFLMNLFVAVITMDFIQVGLRHKQTNMSKEEEKALSLLVEMRKGPAEGQTSSLMNRFSPEVRHDMIHIVANHLKQEQMEKVVWENISPELTKSEVEICKLIVQGLTLGEICEKTGKTESNITSQRTHIRKKLHMEKQENLKEKLIKLVMKNGGGVDSQLC